MIATQSISLQFGGRTLFKDVSFRIGPHDRIGLVGANGAGKTTLLKLLSGEVSPEKGVVGKAGYVTVGYLPQEGVAVTGRTLYRETESVFGDILDTQARLDEVHHRMQEVRQDSPDFEELLEVSGELQHKLEASDAFRMKAHIEKVLMGLGFSERDFERRTEEFSGGWQMRIALAKLLLLQPSLLLLDEPTNHLDLDSLQWLEEYLAGYEGAVIVVSHDRRFLDTVTSTTYELSLGVFTEYPGAFSAYLHAKAERTQQLAAAYRNQQQQIKQTERFIERFRYKATKARQVQSRIKKLEKMEVIELEGNEEEIGFAFPPAPASGRAVMELRCVSKSYGDQQVFSGLDFDIDRGDRIAFVGVNGSGKSTLSRIIAGLETIDAGERKLGHNVSVTYFAQDQSDALDPRLDVLETVEQVATGETRRRLRTLLGCFLFSGDDVFKSVGVLSGGEKSRLSLARMLLQPSNLLVMDEPTNHLDIRSKTVLQNALARYEGSYVIVSHDRDFLEPIVNKVVEFRGGSVRVYLGTISDYIDVRRKEQVEEPQPQKREPLHLSDKERKRAEAELRQRRYERMKPVQDGIAELEEAIEALEERKVEIERRMGNPEFYREGEKVREVTAEYKELEQHLAADYQRWNELTQELERLKDLTSGKGDRP